MHLNSPQQWDEGWGSPAAASQTAWNREAQLTCSRVATPVSGSVDEEAFIPETLCQVDSLSGCGRFIRVWVRRIAWKCHLLKRKTSWSSETFWNYIESHVCEDHRFLCYILHLKWSFFIFTLHQRRSRNSLHSVFQPSSKKSSTFRKSRGFTFAISNKSLAGLQGRSSQGKTLPTHTHLKTESGQRSIEISCTKPCEKLPAF